MEITISPDKIEMGLKAARSGAERIRQALAARGEAFIIVATGASQFDMFEALVGANIDWSKVTAFHLDEYIGMDMTHPASFRKYLKERFADQLHVPLKAFHYIDAETDPAAMCAALGKAIAAITIDVAFVGIGENGHLAFNDPPADFETEEPYLIVDLDEACRRQQLGEGWFPTLEDVPTQAISMSIRQIMKSRTIICTVPDARKAIAVRDTFDGLISPQVPASILRNHEDCHFYLDTASAALLENA